jgi:predicted nucleic acid-binding protein
MPDKAFFDTNVLVYAVAQNDPRQARALALLASGGILSVQILNEFVAVVRGKVQMPWRDVSTALEWFRFLCPHSLPLAVKTNEQAVAIAERYGFQIYDALIVASALEADCDVLFTEDLQDGQIIDDRMTIRNPFR